MSENNFNSYYGSSQTSGTYEDSFSNNYYDDEPYVATNQSITRIALESNVLAQSFLFMCVALIITGITSYLTLSSGLWYAVIMNDAFFYGLLIAEVAIVLIANITISKNQLVPSAILFVAYSVVNGITLSIIFLVYTTSSIVSVFGLAAVMFGAMAFYGITTKRDLSSIGSICIMALLGVIIASFANMFFLHLEGFELALTYVGLLLFVGITVYDVQKIKQITYTADSDNATVLALYGALQLYLDFINIFLKLLRILGKRRK